MPLQNTIKITSGNTIRDLFIPVTDQNSLGIAIRKLLEKKADTSDFWATLGRADNKSVSASWTGSIICSRQGNNSFTDRGRKIKQEAEQLVQLYSKEKLPVSSVTEKFIALKDVQFSDVDSRKLRLTVMLDAGEHVLSFLQHTDISDTTSTDGVFEYILPETVDPFGKKDRLTYLFEIPSNSAAGAFQTVIKVMTYKSDITVRSSVGDVKNKLRELDNPYGIKLFNAAANTFETINDADIAARIDTTKKTLLLIHGTISTVKKSYGDLYDSGKPTAAKTKHDWLQKDILDGKVYEQVIGFDHPSIVDSPQQNAAKLFQLLAPVGSFSKPVDIITTSRGGLVGKAVITTKQTIFKAGRIATVACANGVEILNSAQSIGRFFGALAHMDEEPVSKAALLLVQLVMKVVVELPGIKMMRKDNPELVALRVAKPANPELRILPLCGDYKFSGNHPPEWKFLDLLLGALMKNGHHDWVVETDFQVIMPDGFNAYQQSSTTYRSLSMDTTHLRYFYDPMNTKAKTRIVYFLHDTDVKSAKALPADF